MSVSGSDDVINKIDENVKILSNKELVKKTRILFDSLENDINLNEKLLIDISSQTTYEEIIEKIALVKGQSITIIINRGDYLAPFEIVISEKNSTILDIKNSIKKCYQRELKKTNENNRKLKKHKNYVKKISWKYIWRTYQLEYNGLKLNNDHLLISTYGIKNKSILNFVKKYKKY